MKKTLYFLCAGVIIFLFVLPGCKKEKDETKPLSEIILGKWEVLKEDHNLYLNEGLFRDSTYNYEDNQMVVEFLSSGDGKMYEYDELLGFFSWELDGSDLTVEFFDDGPFELSYDEGSKKMTLTYTETWTEDNINYKYEMILTALKL
jgi:hypothetical protein